MVGVAVKLTLDPAQLVVALAVIETLGVTFDVTLNVSALLVAVCPFTHVALLVTTQVTISPCAKVFVLKKAEFGPTFVPLIFHWKLGDEPPFVGVAVKKTDVPAQILVP